MGTYVYQSFRVRYDLLCLAFWSMSEDNCGVRTISYPSTVYRLPELSGTQQFVSAQMLQSTLDWAERLLSRLTLKMTSLANPTKFVCEVCRPILHATLTTFGEKTACCRLNQDGVLLSGACPEGVRASTKQTPTPSSWTRQKSLNSIFRNIRSQSGARQRRVSWLGKLP